MNIFAIVALIADNIDTITNVLTGIVASCAALASILPNKKASTVLKTAEGKIEETSKVIKTSIPAVTKAYNGIRTVVDVLGFNVGKAKNKDDNQ